MLTTCQTRRCHVLRCTEDASVCEGSQTVWQSQCLAQKVGDRAPERRVGWYHQGLEKLNIHTHLALSTWGLPDKNRFNKIQVAII